MIASLLALFFPFIDFHFFIVRPTRRLPLPPVFLPLISRSDGPCLRRAQRLSFVAPTPTSPIPRTSGECNTTTPTRGVWYPTNELPTSSSSWSLPPSLPSMANPFPFSRRPKWEKEEFWMMGWIGLRGNELPTERMGYWLAKLACLPVRDDDATNPAGPPPGHEVRTRECRDRMGFERRELLPLRLYTTSQSTAPARMESTQPGTHIPPPNGDHEIPSYPLLHHNKHNETRRTVTEAKEEKIDGGFRYKRGYVVCGLCLLCPSVH